jgi:hypothetical protein
MAVVVSDSEHDNGAPRRYLSGAGALASLARPFGRVGRYYAQSWRDYFDQQPGELPIARPTVALAAHALRDEIVLLGLRVHRPVSGAQAFQRISDEVSAALSCYGCKGWLDKPYRYFTRPAPLIDVTVRQVHRGEPGRDRWLGYTGNDREYALMLRHVKPRPWLICVHGTEMGRAAFDLTVFRAWHLHRDLGVNVVLPVLPMHGPRGRRLPRGAVFPG